jgi:hypothetical protein
MGRPLAGLYAIELSVPKTDIVDPGVYDPENKDVMKESIVSPVIQ